MRRFATLLTLVLAVAGCSGSDFFEPTYETNQIPASLFDSGCPAGVMTAIYPSAVIAVLNDKADKWDMRITAHAEVPAERRLVNDDYELEITVYGVAFNVGDGISLENGSSASAHMVCSSAGGCVVDIAYDSSCSAKVFGFLPDGPIFVNASTTAGNFSFQFNDIPEVRF